MTDIKFSDALPGEAPFLSDEEVRQGIELLFFAYRDFTAEPDAILEAYGFGRAHHRVVHFVGRRPQMTVGDLLVILRITKQSLNRVLNDLLTGGYVERRPAPNDRRMRQLRLTPKGLELEDKLWEAQRPRLARAFRDAGPDAVAGFRRVLTGLSVSDRRARNGGDFR